MADKLTELREKLGAKDELMGRVMRELGPELDFSKVTAFGEDLDNQAKYQKFNELEQEMADLQATCRKEHIRQVGEKREQLHEDLRTPVKPVPQPAGPSSFKSLGSKFVETEDYESFRKGEVKGMIFSDPDVELKTLMTTTSGWAGDTDRTGRVIDKPTRPIQVRQLIPMGDTDSSSVTYWEETLRTHLAAEILEGAAFPEDAYELTERTVQVRKIPTSLPVTDEQLEDRAQMRSYIDQRLVFSIQQRLDGQILNGDGVPPNLEGILNVAGIQTQAKGADPTFDAVHKAMTKVRLLGRAIPDAIVMHPNDWEEIRLTRTADGVYIMGNPADPGPMRLFGVPITLADSFSAGTAVVGDFSGYSQLFERRGVDIQVGYVGDQFKEGKQTVRADMRVAFVVYRPEAFAQVTGI